MATRIIYVGLSVLLSLVCMSHSVAHRQENSYPIYKGEEILLLCVTSKDQVYVGEPFTVTFKLLTQRSVSEALILIEPLFSEFSVKQISKPGASSEEVYKGKTYKSTILKHELLIPEKAGRVNISPMRLSLNIEMPPDPSDFFLIEKFSKFEITSALKEINVKQLPGTTHSFSGAIGKYKIETSVSKDSVKHNEPIYYKILIEGNGNSLNLLPPQVLFPSSLESYKPTALLDMQVTTNGYKVKHTYQYTLVPIKAGTIEIPSFSFTYFDIGEDAFKTHKTSAHILNVSAADASTHSADIASMERGPKLILQPSNLIKAGVYTPNSSNYLGIILISIVGFVAHALFVLVIRKRNTNSISVIKRNAYKRAAHQLYSVPAPDQDNYKLISQNILGIISTFISERFRMDGENYSTTVYHIMAQYCVSEDTIVEFKDLVSVYNELGYCSREAEMNFYQLRTSTLDILKQIDREAL
ncbi:hypothetical protein ABID22_000903 [Pontibacter aydingkolensis]|uniref:BatD family protein n=1 Tax=Pontibacter aydingkolensis TaxID=1911536 RepID=A0ABS7CST4_9BACT|nr:BatD family protein [Pontibacter aydingkolensis]MBW7466845.1 BatD family protein [Pontibacter aydingkolensis]